MTSGTLAALCGSTIARRTLARLEEALSVLFFTLSLQQASEKTRGPDDQLDRRG